MSNNFNKGKAAFWIWLMGEAQRSADGSRVHGRLGAQRYLARTALALVLPALLPAVFRGVGALGSIPAPGLTCRAVIAVSSESHFRLPSSAKEDALL